MSIGNGLPQHVHTPGGASSSKRKHKRANPAFWTIQRRLSLLAICCLMLGCTLGIALRSSPLFYVHTVRVRMNGSLLGEERTHILQSVRLKQGINYWNVNTESLAELLSTNPWVESVRVVRSGRCSIQVELKSREPSFALQVTEGTFEVDREGKIIRPDSHRTDLFVLHPPPGVLVKPGALIGFDGWESAKIVAPFRSRLAGLPVKFVSVDRNGDLCLNMMDSVEAQLGRCEHVEEQLKLLERLYSVNPKIGQQVAVIDVRYPSYPSIIDRKKANLQDATATVPQSDSSATSAGFVPRVH